VEEDKRKLENDQLQFEEKKKKENEIFLKNFNQEKIKLETEIQEQLRKSIAADYENQLRMLQDNKEETEEKLKEARKKELDFLKKMQELQNKEEELELEVQKKLQQERTLIALNRSASRNQKKILLKKMSITSNCVNWKNNWKIRKNWLDEMRRKAEQGSMQLQGEVQEQALEELLKVQFPF
jgi:hypothetical protein